MPANLARISSERRARAEGRRRIGRRHRLLRELDSMLEAHDCCERTTQMVMAGTRGMSPARLLEFVQECREILESGELAMKVNAS